ncbi:MAG: iron chelate uptake ABC transporter family permease subunit [Myxococcota bacterium]
MTWMLAPLAMCLVVAGIHCYLGLHVLERKVIFVDLGLAQIAALGTTCAVVLGYEPDRPADALPIFLFSLGFTVLGAAVFAVARMRRDRVPQEAFIGIVYATASALAVLLMARAPGEGEHIKQMLVGNILLVTWPQVATTAAIYAAVGALHLALRRPFREISQDPEAAAARGRRVRAWDFVFYVSFGVVITRSVPIAGVLLVFSYLVVPATCAAMLCDRFRARLAVAWVVGMLASAGGIALSYQSDLPTGPSVVACFAALLILVACARHVATATHRPAALARVAAGLAAIALLLGGLRLLEKRGDEHVHEAEFQQLIAALRSPDDNVAIDAIHHLAERRDPHAVPLLVARLHDDPSERLIEHIAAALPEFRDRSVVPALEAVVGPAGRDLDPFLRIEVARALLRIGAPSGFGAIVRALEDEEAPVLVAKKAAELLREMRGDDFGLAGALTPEARGVAIARLRAWWAQAKGRVRWRAELRRFE